MCWGEIGLYSTPARPISSPAAVAGEWRTVCARSSTRKLLRWRRVHANRCTYSHGLCCLQNAARPGAGAGGPGGTSHITGRKSVPRVSIAMHGVCGLFLQMPEKLRDGIGGFKDRNNRRRFSLPATARYLDLKKSSTTQDSRRSSLASVCSTTCNASLILSFSTTCLLFTLTTQVLIQ